jgi:lipid-binding SYLF domain-containing protein
MKKTIYLILPLIAVLSMAVNGYCDQEKERQAVQQMAQDTLARLYKAHPSAKAAVESGYGYAVFDNFGMKIFVLGGGKGQGIAVSNKTGDTIYMKMVEVQGGLGFGGKTFPVIMVFENKNVFDNFVNNGWEFGGQATAAVKHAEEGTALQGATSVSPGIWMYQLTKSGLEATITAKGTKYYKNDTLN